MQAFTIQDLGNQQTQSGKGYLEFLRFPSMSMGLYHLKAGQPDRQSPHSEDEVYYVLSGRSSFRAGDQVMSVGPGNILFVERLVEHRFFGVVEDLTVLVFFAPAEGSLKK